MIHIDLQTCWHLIKPSHIYHISGPILWKYLTQRCRPLCPRDSFLLKDFKKEKNYIQGWKRFLLLCLQSAFKTAAFTSLHKFFLQLFKECSAVIFVRLMRTTPQNLLQTLCLSCWLFPFHNISKIFAQNSLTVNLCSYKWAYFLSNLSEEEEAVGPTWCVQSPMWCRECLEPWINHVDWYHRIKKCYWRFIMTSYYNN